MNTILAKVKTALRISVNDFDDEIQDLIDGCLKDLGIAGITEDDTTDPLLIRAIITYCRLNFGDLARLEDYDRLKSSYDEQKAQMSMATGYTDWLNNE